MESFKDKYAIVGVGYTPQGEVPDRTELSFHIEASVNAIKDAGLNREDVDGLIAYRHFQPMDGETEVTVYRLAQMLGLSPNYLSQEATCARSHLHNALGVLEQDLCDYVLISYGSNDYSKPGKIFTGDVTKDDDDVFGLFGAAGPYAMAAQRAKHEYGTGPETWKEIAVGQRKWANKNPKATMYEKPLTYEDYYESPYVAEPFRRADCCLMSDGGRAFVVTSLENAKSLDNSPAVIMGLGQHNPSTSIKQSTYMAGPSGAKIAGEKAFKMAGIGPEDVDACEIYDCFTYTVEITLQDYGFFEPGEGEEWFEGGTISPGGSMPVNTSGGLLSEAYFMGLTPITEGAMQIMGRCGERQLGSKTETDEPEIILCSDNGEILQTHSTVILRRL